MKLKVLITILIFVLLTGIIYVRDITCAVAGINNRTESIYVNEKDSLALVALYNSTDGENWKINTNWLTINQLDSWYGITVDSGRVRRIVLIDNNLVGSIPPEIGDLTDLRAINLRQNELTGRIPPEIGNLIKLDSLDIYNNQLTGELPREMGNMVSLSFIKLSQNQITGTIPEEFTKLTNLETLAISSNKLDDEFPDHILSMTKLKYLWLQWNQFTGTIPSEIGDLENLVALSLHSNNFTGSYPKEIGELTKLKFLYLGNVSIGDYPANNQCTGTIPPEFGNLVNLERFWLIDEENIIGPIPKEFGNLTKLWQVSLNGNRLTGSVPDEFKNMISLQSLRLNNNLLTGLPDLSSLSDLIWLNVENNKLSFEDIEPNIRISSFSYSPQDSIGTIQDTTLNTGSTFMISVSVGGTANQYQWMKDNIDIQGATDSIYTISYYTDSDSGVYVCRITNTIATELILYSHPFCINVSRTTGIEEHSDEIPEMFVLNQNYPNPFNPCTQIAYRLPKSGIVSLNIYNIHGQLVRKLVNEYQKAGEYTFFWDGTSDKGDIATTGIYFYRLGSSGNGIKTRKMMLLR